MKRLVSFGPAIFVLGLFLFLYREVFFNNAVLVPADTLIGTFLPWLDYQWGFPTGVAVKNPLLSDAYSHFFIHKHIISNLLKEGIAPLWNRYILAGTPLLATYHTNPFFPANLFLLLPKFTGWNLYILTSHLAAFLSLYLYLGFRLKSRLVRLIASTVYAFFGPMTTWSEFGTAVWAASILPLLLLCLDFYFQKRRLITLPIFSLLIALLFFAGHLQLDTYAAVILFSYTIYLFFQQKEKSLSHLLLLIPFTALGIGLSQIQLLPTVDLLGRSIRTGENYASNFNYGLVDFPHLLRLIVPDFFGHPATYNFWSSQEYHEFSGFLGALTLPLILPLFFTRPTAYRRFFLITFITSLVLVTYHSLSRLLFSLPLPLLTFSYASRLFFVTGLSAAILLAESLSDINTHKISKRYFFSGMLFLALIGLSLYLSPSTYFSVALRNSILPIGFLAGLLVLLILRPPKIILLLLLLLFFSFDLSRYYRKYNPAIAARLTFPSTPALDYVLSQPGLFRIAREKTNLLPPNTWAYYGLESVEGYEPLRPLNYGRLFHLLEDRSYTNLTGRFSELESVNPKYLSALNVRYFFIANQPKPTKIQQLLFATGFKPVFTDRSVTVLENPHVSPRAYFVSRVETVPNESDLIQRLESDTFDPNQTALISTQLPAPITYDPHSTIDITNYQANTISLKTSSSTNQFLLLADTYDPGWMLTLDGQSAPIYPANGALRGVFVPSGNHQLNFAYRPLSFTMGTRISLISLILISLAFIYSFYHGRKTSR